MSATEPGGMSYARTRQLILVAGLVVLLLTAVVMYVRRVDPVEVGAILLFIPIFVAFVFQGLRGGLVAAVLATAAYAALRYPAMKLVGGGQFTSLIVSRGIAFLAFGAIGGLASNQLESSLTKLDLFDQIDDATGLFNARFFVDNTGLEVSRSERYRTLFSVTVVDIPVSAFEALDRRQRTKTLKDLGQLLKDSVRSVDRPVHTVDRTRHRFAAILPETGRDGGRVFVSRLAEEMVEQLNRRGANLTIEAVAQEVATFPGDDAQITQLREEFAALDAVEHPEATDKA